MVATRNLKAGDIILRKKAAVVGPSMEQSTDQVLAPLLSVPGAPVQQAV